MSSAAASRRAPRKRRKSGRASSKSGQGLTSWLVVLGLVAGGIAVYENRTTVMRDLNPYLTQARRVAKVETSKAASNTPIRQTPPANHVGVAHAPVPPKIVGRPAEASVKATEVAMVGPVLAGASGPFYFCGTSGLDMCVASGDSFWYKKKRYVLADVVAPRTDNAGCAQEREKGFAAKVRLRNLLNAGKFDLEAMPAQGGTAGMRVATRNGRSLGSLLVSEGLAKPRAVKADIWCR